MITLTPTQQKLLTAAVDRPDGLITLPPTLKGAAAARTTGKLLAAGLIEQGRITPSRRAAVGSKQAQVVDLLRRGNGVTIAELMAATGWQAHSVRGFLSRLGLPVISETGADGQRRYHIAVLAP